ncbi:hypothetical protein HPE56_09640 [Maribacter sp. ANRC-HE7]|uniref:Lipocalin-like domain-containing protein n=1 Tax=Maribacter aquimaris TaxID=2737171 RepID=A0ABR7V276_9FLAO|nr:hypothetical protein [Maribacter aquimaris]MBD0778055.1 hypothetical protein [Maribacter aquimaris]
MKQIYLIVIVITSCVGFSNAQEEQINGHWLVTKITQGDESYEPFFIQNFKENGKLEVMGQELGTWGYHKKSNAIIMMSDFDKDYNGEGKILKLTGAELVVLKDGTKINYEKLDRAEIAASNKKSNINGMWQFKNLPSEYISSYISFREPDEFTIIQKSENSETKLKGTWIFNKKDMSLIMIGLRGENMPIGKNKIVRLTDDMLELENDGKIFIVERKISGKEQESLVMGKWVLTEMQKGEEIKEVDSGVIFAENGVLKMGFFHMQEILEVGTWAYDENQNTIVMTSADEKVLNGNAEILELSSDTLQYRKEGIIYRFKKYIETID